MFIERKIHQALREHLDRKQITVITGMRRTGKTTLVKELLKEVPDNKIYLDLERLSNRDVFAERNYDNIIETLSSKGIDFSKKAYIALDEIQLMRDIPSVLKYLYDHYDIKFIISGSSSYYLKGLFNESMAGRKKIFEVFPLDFGEFLSFKGVERPAKDFKGLEFSKHEYADLGKYYEEYIRFGGFPEVALAKSDAEKKDIVSDILSSYVNVDVKSLADFKDERNVYNLMKILAGRIGTKLDYSKISRLSSLSIPTVMSYINFFEKTYLIFRLPVHAKHPDKEIVKAQKLYFCDNGIANLLHRQSSGAMFENAVFSQLRHKGGLRYYSLKSGREIDFVVDGSLGLEVKESPDPHDLMPLKELSKSAGLKKYRLVGRKPVPRFKDYVWGGSIR